MPGENNSDTEQMMQDFYSSQYSETSMDATPTEFALALARGIPDFVEFVTRENVGASSEIDTQYGQKNKLFGIPQCMMIQLIMSSIELESVDIYIMLREAQFFQKVFVRHHTPFQLEA